MKFRSLTTPPAAFFVGVIFALSIGLGCDATPNHPSRKALESALQAVQYGDVEGLTSVHLEATQGSVYCAEEPMQRLWEKAGSVAEGGACDRLESISGGDLEEAPDELRFLLQVVRFRCEMPEGSCSAYGARALTDGLETSSIWQSKPQSWEIRKFLGDETSAIAYVDIETVSGTIHRAVKLTKRDGRWFVASGLLEGDGA